MILTGRAIADAVAQGDILLRDWVPRQLNPNSYNFRLHDHLIHVADGEGFFDLPRPLDLGSEGVVLQPRNLYLGATAELIGSRRYVMTLLGRSSIGRLGLFLNATADLGHVGSCSRWTLELSVVQPLRIYPGMLVGQIAFWHETDHAVAYQGRYSADKVPVTCRDPLLGLAA